MQDLMHLLEQHGYPVFTHKLPADVKIMYRQSLLQKGNLRTLSFRPPGEISCFKARYFSLTLEMTTKNISTVFLLTRPNQYLVLFKRLARVKNKIFLGHAETSIPHGHPPSTFSPLTLCKRGR